MLLSLAFAALLTATPADAEPLVCAFVEGLRREDRFAVRGARPLRYSDGTGYMALYLYDDIDIQWYRISAIEQGESSTFVTVEMDATARAANTGDRVPFPRWWSFDLLWTHSGWRVDTVLTLERRLAGEHALSTPEQLTEVVRKHPGLDLERFTYLLMGMAVDINENACETVLWILREAEARGRLDLQTFAYQLLADLAIERLPDPSAAVTSAERAVVLAEAYKMPDQLMDAWYSAGMAYQAAGRVDDAVAALRRSASFYDRTLDSRAANRALNLASEMELARNNVRAALADAELYQKMITRVATPGTLMQAAMRIGDIHDRLGNNEIARRHYEEALAIARGQHHPEAQVQLLHKTALQASAMGDVAGARRILERANALHRYLVRVDVDATARTELARFQREDGDLEAAERTLAGALALTAKPLPAEIVASMYVQRSLLRHAQGRPAEALEDARIAREKGGSSLAEALTAEGRALRDLSRHDEAEAVLRTAIDVVELDLSGRQVDETGSASVLRGKLAPYRELLDLLVEDGCAREALNVAELMRARSLRESLRHGRVDLSAGMDEAKRGREQELERTLAGVNRSLLAATDAGAIARLHRERDEGRLALRRFRSELYAAHPGLDHRRGLWDQQLPVVAPGELVLELAVGDQSTFLFVLQGEDVAVHRIAVSRARLEEQVDAFVTSLEQRDFAYRPPARALHDLLLGPVNASLAAAKTVRIVPDGALWRLPFHALVDARGRHLIERLPVAYSPSVALTQAASRAGPRRALLAFGDPAVQTATANVTRSLFRDVTLGRLPEAASEARTIARLYSDAEVRVGAEALESAFKDDAPAFRLLHLAAHSIVDDRSPMFSSIVLSSTGANPLEDGLLEAREIADLKLRADVAVLSACETARGAVTAGEGMIGLSWAFLAAGVPTTVVSQWRVASGSTAELMIDFHRNLRDGAGVAEALRAAMLALRRNPQRQHPFYWAPFVVVENSGIPSERQ